MAGDRINGEGPGIMRAVKTRRRIGTRHHGGFAPRTGVWELGLESGTLATEQILIAVLSERSVTNASSACIPMTRKR